MVEQEQDNPPAGWPLVYYPAKAYVVFLLSIVSLGIYAYWWHYQNWRLIKQQTRQNIIPLIRAFFHPFFCYSLFDRIAGSASTANLRGVFLLRLLGLLALLSALSIHFEGKLSSQWFDDSVLVMYFFSIAGLSYVQFKVNQIHAFLETADRKAAYTAHQKVLSSANIISSPPFVSFARPLTAQPIWAYGQFRFIEVLLVVGILGVVTVVGMEIAPMYVNTARLVEPLYMARDLEYQMAMDAAMTGSWPARESLGYTIGKNTTPMVAFENISNGGIQLLLLSKNSALDKHRLGFNVSTLDSGGGFVFYSWQCADAVAPFGHVTTAFITDVARFNSHTLCR